MGTEFVLLQLITPVASIVLAGPLVLYLIARWRANRDVPDPHLGFKFVIHYFATIAFHVSLIGGVLLIYTMIKPGGDDGEPKGKLYRLAFGFILPGLIILGAHLALLMRTNDSVLTGVRRLFAGFNLLISGLVGFAALVLGFQALFAKGSTNGMGHLGGAAILVYGTAWGLLAWRFAMMVFDSTSSGSGSGSGSSSMRDDMPDIVPPAPKQAAGGGGGLPPLGGGSYPPIEPR